MKILDTNPNIIKLTYHLDYWPKCSFIWLDLHCLKFYLYLKLYPSWPQKTQSRWGSSVWLYRTWPLLDKIVIFSAWGFFRSVQSERPAGTDSGSAWMLQLNGTVHMGETGQLISEQCCGFNGCGWAFRTEMMPSIFEGWQWSKEHGKDLANLPSCPLFFTPVAAVHELMPVKRRVDRCWCVHQRKRAWMSGWENPHIIFLHPNY